MLYGCVTWGLRACHYDTLRRVHRRFLTRCIGWRADHPISYLDTLLKTGVRASRRLYAGGGSCLRDLWRAWRIRGCRSAGCSEKWWGVGAVWGAREKSGWGVSWTTSELSASTPTSGGLQPRTSGNGAERQNKGRSISWRNGSLVAEKAKAGLQHARVCPNVTGRTEERIAQSKRARAGSLALVD